MKIFQLNDCDWVMANNLEEAIKTLIEETGTTREEAYDEAVAHELTDQELDMMKFTDDDEARGDGSLQTMAVTRTFKQEMARRKQVSQFFASTEF
jgi:hypothetical protein